MREKRDEALKLSYVGFLDLITARPQRQIAAALDTAATRGIVSPWQAAESPMTAITLSELFPDVAAPIGRPQAMAIGSIAKCRHIVTGMISRFPLVHMIGTQRAAQQSAFVKQPEIGRPLSTSLTWWVDSMLFYGRAWLLVDERFSEDHRPRRVRWVPEHKATVNSRGDLVKAWGEDVNAMNVIRIDGPHEGILNFGRAAIREAIDVAHAAARAAGNPVPSIELHQTGGTPLTAEQRKELVSDWAAARSGRNGGVAYTNQMLEVKTHGQAAEQLLIAERNATAVEMARMCGLPAWAVDAVVEGSSMTYSNTPSRTRELIDFGLQPYMTAITDRLSLDDVLAAGHWVRFDTSQALAPDFKTRMDGYKAAVDAGIYTAEECRQIEAGVPLEEARA